MKNKRRFLHPIEDKKDKKEPLFPFRYSKFKTIFYGKTTLDDNTRKIIKFVNSMQKI